MSVTLTSLEKLPKFVKLKPTKVPISFIKSLETRIYRNITRISTMENSRRKDDDNRYYKRGWRGSIDHTIYIHSCYYISGQSLYISVDEEPQDQIHRRYYKLTLPKPWVWDILENSIGIKTSETDYHVSWNRLLDEYNSLIDNANKQFELRKQQSLAHQLMV